MSSPMKVYQIAEQLGIEPDVAVVRLKAHGFAIGNKMSKIDPEKVEAARAALQKEKEVEWEEVRMPDGVVKRRRRVVAAPEPVHAPSAPPSPPSQAVEPAPAPAEPSSTPPSSSPEAHAEPAVSSEADPMPAPEPAPAPAPTPAPEPAPATEPEPTPAPAPAPATPPAPEPVPAPAPAPMPAPAPAPAPVPAAAAKPSIPAAPRTGISTWNPDTKQVIHHQRREINMQGQPPGRPPGRPARGGAGGARNIPRGPRVPKSTGVTLATQMSAHKRVVKIEGSIALKELANRMAVKASEVLMKLLQMGMPGVNINTTLDADTAKLLAQEFNYEVDDVAVNQDEALKAILPVFAEVPEDYEPRPPVVTVMGHVDHGKTTLLDAILGMRVAEGEAGGITQKVSAYRVETKKGPVVFFDTPGHEAFTKLRARGAETTDVAVLVVAADDGVMPTTVEAIHHVQAAEVPLVVALNKMDKPDAKPDRVLQQLMEYNVVAEQFGGEVLVCKVSAKQRQGIEELVENLALQSEILDLRANPKKPAVGTVFDATLDRGKGVVARILVQDGTLRSGDVIVAGSAYGKIRAMFDDRGKPIQKAPPSTPVEVLGLNELPNAGDGAYVVQDVKKAMAYAEERKRVAGAQRSAQGGITSLQQIQDMIAAGEQLTVGVIIKAEAQASVEALSKALTDLGTDKVKVQIVHSGIGGITESDVNLAVASNKFPTTILGFNVRPQGKAQALAESEKVQIRLYTVIYEAVDEIKAMMEGQLKPNAVEKALGKAEVRQVFNITKIGTIAGCMVTEGSIKRNAYARLVRDSVEVWKGKLGSLRRFKEDAKEVNHGYECGIGLENYGDLKPGDVIEAYEIEEVAARL